MKIVSAFPYVWPHLGFALAVGENEIDENKIPLSAHAKLLHLSKPGIDATGTPIPAPISGYKPSTALADEVIKVERIDGEGKAHSWTAPKLPIDDGKQH